MAAYSDVLVYLRTRASLSQQELADKLGMTRSAISMYETGKREPDLETFEAFADFYNVDMNTLTGHSYEITDGFGRIIDKRTGAILRQIPNFNRHPVTGSAHLSVEAIKLAKDYDDLDHWGQKQVRSTADIEAARVADERRRGRQGETQKGNVIYLPFQCSIQPASAGTGTYLGPEAFEIIHVRENDLTRRAAFGVPVQGDSMEPTYHNGDVLIVEGAEEIEPGEIGIFTIDGEGYVKELGEEELISLNPKYDPIPINESIRCHGRVIGVLDPAWIADE